MKFFHKSVLYKEALDALDVRQGETYVDATLAGGGHTEGILKAGGKVIGIDLDPEALSFVKDKLSSDRLILEEGNFSQIDKILEKHAVSQVAGVLFDLGVSSHQLDTRQRGFGFKNAAPLDMRMSPKLSVTAADLINGLNEGELYELFTKLGEEHYARRIARAVVAYRSEQKIEQTDQLATLVEKVMVGSHATKVHPATRIFLALRIAVNDELNNLKEALPKATERLKKGGRLVVISFHSLEDRIVKDFIKANANLKDLTKKPVVPTEREIKENPRARSAKLRVAERM